MSEKKVCSHCHQSYAKLFEVEIGGERKAFCCKGCEGVYRFLHEGGYEDFYELLGDKTLKPPKEKKENLSYFDSDGFKQSFLFKNDQGFMQVSFVIDGIFCSACIDLLERALSSIDGIYDFSINHTNYKLKLIYDEKKLALSHVANLVQKLGYDLIAYNPDSVEKKNHAKNREYFFSLVVAIFCTMNIMWVAVSQYTGYFLGSSQEIKDGLNLAAFLLATPVLFYTGRSFFKNAYFQIKNKSIGMDMLVITGASLTYGYSIYAALMRSHETYFEAVAMIICFVFGGRFLEVRAKKYAGDVMDSLSQLLPKEVLCIRDGKQVLCAVEEVGIGEIIEVPAFGIVPIDGVLLNESALCDMQNITGEPMAVLLKKHEMVLSGSFAQNTALRIETKKQFSQSLLFSLVDTLENALNKRPKISSLAQKISLIFSPLVILIALCGGLWWYFVLDSGFDTSLMVAISVIVISCPCALALATPIACVVGVSQAYKHHIIFKQARSLEALAKVKCVVFDKTGTLSKGKPKVVKHLEFSQFDPALLRGLLEGLSHPIAKGVLQEIGEGEKKELDFKEEILGKGVVGYYHDRELLGGSLEFLQDRGIEISKEVMDHALEALGVFAFSIGGRLSALFLLDDALKEGSIKLVRSLQQAGILVVLLSGDNKANVVRNAKKLGIERYYYSQLPMQKAEVILNLKQSLKKNESLVMVGDGVNDALALGESGIGISFLGKMQNLTSHSSDVVLLSPEIKTLDDSFKIAKKSYSIIKQNLIFSLVYNIVMIPLALCGWIIPLFAALSMSLSSLCVVLNSLRIKIK